MKLSSKEKLIAIINYVFGYIKNQDDSFSIYYKGLANNIYAKLNSDLKIMPSKYYRIDLVGDCLILRHGLTATYDLIIKLNEENASQILSLFKREISSLLKENIENSLGQKIQEKLLQIRENMIENIIQEKMSDLQAYLD